MSRPQPLQKFERNEALYKDYKDGMSIVDMVAKYRVTSTRIYQIVNRHERFLDDIRSLDPHND